MAAHIVELHKQANRRGVDIWRMIFDSQPYSIGKEGLPATV